MINVQTFYNIHSADALVASCEIFDELMAHGCDHWDVEIGGPFSLVFLY